MPDPLTPKNCNLQNFPFMPLDVERLRASDLALTSDAETFRAAVLLWCAAWHQVPAASLPDDDRVLAQLAGFGRFVKDWQKVRTEALRGFVKCSDGRLYHHVVAEKANEAWRHKEAQRARTEAARQAKQQRSDNNRDNRRNSGSNNGAPPAATASVTAPENDLLQAPIDREREKDREKEDSQALRACVERVFDALWRAWPDVARKRHPIAKVREAIRAQLKAGADAEAIIAAGKAHVEERTSSGKPETVKGLVPWLTSGVWQNWAPTGNGAHIGEPPDWPRRLTYFHNNGVWPEKWGPPPGAVGYLGPPIDDLFAGS